MLIRILIGLLVVASSYGAPEQWASEIETMVKAPPPQAERLGSVVFVGSSSIKLWSSLKFDFPKTVVVNSGFGGSELADSVYYADKIVFAYEPSAIVLYAGENDLWSGKTPEAVLAAFRAFQQKVKVAAPNARLFYLSIKESPSRARIREAVLRTNELIAAECKTEPKCRFVDVASPMLDGAGHTRPELFREDMLHMNAKGYAIWTKTLEPLLELP